MDSARRILPTILLLIPFPTVLAAQATQTSAPLSVDDVIKMSKNGIAEELIITKIKTNGKAFDLNPDELETVHKLGVTDNVVRYLLDPSLPYAAPRAEPPQTPAKITAPAKKYPNDPNAARVPPDPGLYRLQQYSPVPIEIKLLLGEKEGAGLGKFLMKKARVIAYILGSTAKMTVAETSPVFYLRLPEGKGIEEVLLVAMEKKSDRRELDMGPGPKPELKPEMMRQFDSVEVGAGLYKVTPASLVRGEYLFYLMGSAEPPKGNYGKGYDFSVQPPQAGKEKKH